MNDLTEGLPINTATWDSSPFLSRDWPADGSKLYFATSERTGHGGFDVVLWEATWRAPSPRFVRGECNADGNLNIADVLCALNWLFAGGTIPGCVAAVNIADPIALLSFLFAGGVGPGEPFPECGPGTLPVDLELGCETLLGTCE